MEKVKVGDWVKLNPISPYMLLWPEGHPIYNIKAKVVIVNNKDPLNTIVITNPRLSTQGGPLSMSWLYICSKLSDTKLGKILYK